MKKDLTKKELKQNLVENVKAIKEVGHIFEKSIDDNTKNTKELYLLLKKELEINKNISADLRKVIEKEIEAYEKAIDKSTSEEERKIIYDKLEKLVDISKRNCDDSIANNKELREGAIKIQEENRKFNWELAIAFGIGTLAIIGAFSDGAKGLEKIQKLIAKK